MIEPSYPKEASLDYRPRAGMAHVALPRFDAARGEFAGQSRIWIKGSEERSRARIDGREDVELGPPFFTAIVEVQPGIHRVSFGEADTEDISVLAPAADALNAPKSTVMLLGYGCFDPFDLDTSEERRGEVFVSPGDGTGKPGAKDDRYPRFAAIRRVLQLVAKGGLKGVPGADLVLGGGDQVYVEPVHDRYGEFGDKHPLSAWTVEAMPRPRLSLSGFYRFLDVTYRAFWSFDSMDEVFRTVPTVLTWDDHEIRDGWGSQGDEHVYLDTFYAAAREAFLAHQFARGPMGEDAHRGGLRASLHQAFTLHGIPIFVMDQRSARDVHVPQVLGSEQTDALKEWLHGIDPTEQPVCVVVSPLPMLYRVSGLAERVVAFDEANVDDMLDSWNSTANEAELDQLMIELSRAYDRGVRPLLISGDMHTSALLSARRKRSPDGPSEVFVHEMVVSGLASVVDESSWKFELAKENSLTGGDVEVGDELMNFEIGLSRPVPNFGGLEIRDGRVHAHVFQAQDEGVVHFRVPLGYGLNVEPLSERVEAGREVFDASTFPR
ncbi:alkaline phosphatase D family protein [Saltatorellus ferox]|uniref:alkaline phosphatase D family protein n=1 Tax=Saltatorellus ferox TaxID=2528018 RepID=UPI003AF35972